jgi:hypothetical protein
MKMNHMLALLALISPVAALIATDVARAEDDVAAVSKEKLAQFDAGPSSIDISAYPAGLQKNYAVFREKCTLCHTLARPVNCDFVLPDEWSRYIKRMMHKPGSMITGGQAKKIYEFLAFDSSVRKKALFDERLSKAAPADKADAESRIKEILDAYAQK